ncbi:MAG: HD domain-containing protein [Deltaproteobacteria bacterium]|nr:HD domain-containing protein [Deltaproteobacteria bacterium]
MTSERLPAQLAFLREADKLKGILRHSRVTFAARRENDAEHSWHLALAAMILAEYAEPGLDLLRTIEMVLIHDLVEIDAGDTIAYASDAAKAAQAERERAAAERLFGLLPADQGSRLRALFGEFEQRRTREARFARALDRVQPILQNLHSHGAAWRANGVTAQMVRDLNEPIIRDASPALWQRMEGLIAEAEANGCFPAPDAP